ncbi:MAG TPA: type I secretion system permease/ATPase [Caulobacteraceae bacterium]|jgi:subfamily B ATP-binding cassette protein HlyB/CyaB|nr:type I secretion system permease/ATPase [Caulobacteraceae bacterium]
MSETQQTATPADPAAAALAFALQVLGLPANAAEIVHQSGRTRLDANDLIRFAKKMPVKVRLITSTPARLASTPTPALAVMRDGRWLVVGRIADDKILIQDPFQRTPQLMDFASFSSDWTGQLLLLARRASLTDPHQRFGISWFIVAMQKYRRPLLEVLTSSFFVQLFALLTPLFFQVIIDKVFVQRGLSTLEVLAIGMATMGIFDVSLTGVRIFLLAHTSNRVDVELGARLFRHLFALPMAYFHSRRVGDTIARVRELDNIRQFLTSSALTLSLDLFFALIFLFVLFIYSPILTLVVAAALPLYVFLSVGVTPAFRTRLNERFRRGSENQSFLVEAISGVETVKSMALEPVMQRRWEEQLAAYVKASFSVITLNTFGSQTAAFINKMTVVLVLFIGAKQVIEGHLTVGELVAFNMISSQLAAPVLRIAQLWQDFQQVRISIDRTGDILNTTPEPGYSGSARLPPIRGEVKLEGVNFRYRLDAQLVLHDVDLTIPAGQVLGVVGSSGSGKSTLAKLIQRLYVPETGRVTVDGHDLALVDPAWLRRQIGVVLQENILFNRTVRDNISLADPSMPMERVIEAAGLAGAHEFITGLPEGYNTMIGERGASLSGGQRQRVAIARALATNPRILMFDEATSALDYESEAAIQANMRRICAGRTVILIAHRLSTLRIANRIIAVEKGEIVEDGSHQALLREGGRYATLWGLQTADFAPAANAV